MKITAEPRSDQWNADDFVGGPRVFTIAGVKPGSAEQKYDVELVEGEGRAWRPPLTMLRLLIAAWGDETVTWAGRRVELYRDESIRFGKDAVGGIRISRMSDLPDGKQFRVALTEARGKRKTHVVDPLPDATPAPAVSKETLAELTVTLARKGIPEDAWLSGANQITGGSATELEALTEGQARQVLDALASRPDVDGEVVP